MTKEQLEQLYRTAVSDPDEKWVRYPELNTTKRNQLIFFFKPECFLLPTSSDTKSVMSMSLDKMTQHSVSITGALLLGGSSLGRHGIMDRHYGYINTLSRSASSTLNEVDYAQIADSLEIVNLSDYAILGGHEFLSRYVDFDAGSLNEFWFAKRSHKIRSGFYVQRYNVNGDKVILVNGFHPLQLQHYTDPSHKILVLVLETDSSWEVLKNMMVGETYPEKANPLSIRGELYRAPQQYGVNNVSIANNFVHLSAGPFEASFEMVNFLSSLDDSEFSVRDSNLGAKMIKAGYSTKDVVRAIGNPSTEIDGDQIDLFSLTENMDTAEAVAVYSQHFD